MSSPPPRGFDLRVPGWFLHDLDPDSGRASFVRTDRASLSAEPFLDHRWREPHQIDAALPLAELEVAGSRPPRLNFIWHTSFCASTLLSACLDSPGRCLALKEPRVLVQLADMKRRGLLHHTPGLAANVFGLLARRFDQDEQILVKPSNGANSLIADAANLTTGPMLLLYSSCESFLLSMAKQGGSGFTFVRSLFGSLASEHPIGSWPVPTLLSLTDLQLAALVWRMQMDILEAASARLGHRARSLDCRLLLDDPGHMLTKIDAFLGLNLGPERLDAVVNGPLLNRDAKQPDRTYDSRSRAEAEDKVRAQLGTDLPAVLRWIEAVSPVPPKLATPLLGPAPSRSWTEDFRMTSPAA
jgi:hypothetical protein